LNPERVFDAAQVVEVASTDPCTTAALAISGVGAAVAQLDPLHRDRAVTMAHDALAPVRQPRVPHRGQERVGFRFDGLGQQPTRAAP
jgi:hypothetical protein